VFEVKAMWVYAICKVLWQRKGKKRKNSAGSDDTASMVKGGVYLSARTRQIN
jgi:hypothetical protein